MRDWELFKRLAFQSRKTLGVDMEAAAVGYAAYRTRRPMIVAKGVSDYADGGKNDAGQGEAALASARFVLSFLSQHPLPPRPTRTFGLQRDAYAELLAYVAAHKVESAVLIQYSNVVATDLLFHMKDNSGSGPPYMARGAETPGTLVYRGSPEFEVFRRFIVRTAQEIGERAEKETHVVTGREVEPPLPSPLLHSPQFTSEKS
jgi:hypothetical protein